MKFQIILLTEKHLQLLGGHQLKKTPCICICAAAGAVCHHRQLPLTVSPPRAKTRNRLTRSIMRRCCATHFVQQMMRQPTSAAVFTEYTTLIEQNYKLKYFNFPIYYLQGDFFNWSRPKSSKCWRWQNP